MLDTQSWTSAPFIPICSMNSTVSKSSNVYFLNSVCACFPRIMIHFSFFQQNCVVKQIRTGSHDCQALCLFFKQF